MRDDVALLILIRRESHCYHLKFHFLSSWLVSKGWEMILILAPWSSLMISSPTFQMRMTFSNLTHWVWTVYHVWVTPYDSSTSNWTASLARYPPSSSLPSFSILICSALWLLELMSSKDHCSSFTMTSDQAPSPQNVFSISLGPSADQTIRFVENTTLTASLNRVSSSSATVSASLEATENLSFRLELSRFQQWSLDSLLSSTIVILSRRCWYSLLRSWRFQGSWNWGYI